MLGNLILGDVVPLPYGKIWGILSIEEFCGEKGKHISEKVQKKNNQIFFIFWVSGSANKTILFILLADFLGWVTSQYHI